MKSNIMQNIDTEYKEAIVLKASDNQLCTQVGKLIDGCMTSIGEEGFLLFGPYIALEKGYYRLFVYGDAFFSGNLRGYFDIVTMMGKEVISKITLSSADKNGIIGTINFQLTEKVENVEFRVYVTKECNISIDRYEIYINQSLSYHTNTTILPCILMTGNIRDREAVLNKLDFFNQLKKEGLISQIIFSTWKGEIDKDSEIIKKLEELNCIVVESDSPDFSCRGSYLHQIIQLENGLDACPYGSFVFKTRTDKCGPESGFIDEQIRNFFLRRDYIRPCVDKKNVFQYKIATVENVVDRSLQSPVFFFWIDQWYFGYKNDLLKLINHSILTFDYEGLVPEQALFYHVFRGYSNALSMFILNTNQAKVIEIIAPTSNFSINIMNDFTEFLISNKLFKHAFLTERYILSEYFFDISTGRDIVLKTEYCGIELGTPDEVQFIASHHQPINYEIELQELQGYLKQNFAIEPILHKEIIEGSIRRYVYHRKPLEYCSFLPTIVSEGNK